MQGRTDFLDCDVAQLVAKRRVAGEDLNAFTGGRPIGVTIEGVTVENFTKRGSNKPEVVYELWVREFSKPLKLSTTRLATIGKFLGTTRLREWTGRIIQIEAVKDFINDDNDGSRKMIWCIEYTGAPSQAASMPAKQDITGYAIEAANRPKLAAGSVPGVTEGMLGDERAIAIHQNLHTRNRTWEDLAGFISSAAPQLKMAITDIKPYAWPQAVIPWTKTYFESISRTKPKLSDAEMAKVVEGWRPPKTAVVDHATGEVIDPDDIPF
jgi:hypothetical protein